MSWLATSSSDAFAFGRPREDDRISQVQFQHGLTAYVVGPANFT
jgi:hypothetical protein